MHALVVWIEDVLVPWLGAPGMLLACFLDSSFLSLPEISDLLVVTSAAAKPAQAWLPVLIATLGSFAGCSVLWWIGLRGGEAFLVRRFGRERVEKTRDTFQRWDILALVVSAWAPPPVPFKLFVLSAGVFEMPFSRFALTMLLARGSRYVFWAVLGVVYGERARELLQAMDAWAGRHFAVLLAVVIVAVVGFVVVHLTRLRRRGA
jgi:membrane protein YqaA with SNARE-associated domain